MQNNERTFTYNFGADPTVWYLLFSLVLRTMYIGGTMMDGCLTATRERGRDENGRNMFPCNGAINDSFAGPAINNNYNCYRC